MTSRWLPISLTAFLLGGGLVYLYDHRLAASVPALAPSAASTAALPAHSSSLANTTDQGDTLDDDDNWPDSAPSPEQVMYAQSALVQQALGQLTPRVSGKPNLYLVTFAGDGSEDVFRNEAEYAGKLFAQRYGNRAHTVVLENNPATLSTHPLATWSNLEAVLKGLDGIMDTHQDILMLYLTTHGDHEHNLLVDLDPLPLDQIGANDLAGILAEQHFDWKVVVVNACYSGGFIPPLKGAGTLVMTAARTDRSSFGCGTDSDLTYFGHAWLVDGLNKTPDFVKAFGDAKQEIHQWESRDRLTPSAPQIAIGDGILAQLGKWREGMTVGAPLPFKPAPGDLQSSAASAP